MKVLVKSTILKLARETIRRSTDVVAKKLGVSEEVLITWENTDSEIAISHLRTLSNLYKRPLGFFLLNNPPKLEKLPTDFRVNYANEEENLTPEIILVIRRAREIQSNAIDLPRLDLTDNQIIFKSTLEDDPEIRADSLRKKLNISLQEQSNWENPYIAYKSWKDLIEFHFGILVLEYTLPLNEVRALSLNHNKKPLILINSADVQPAKIFSLFHELYHISLGNEGVCDLDETTYKLPFQKQQIEIACNKFSAEFLVPKKSFLQSALNLNILHKKDFSDEKLILLAKYFNVSKYVILRRFLSLDYIDEENYFNKISQWKKEYEGRRRKKGRGFSNPVDKSVRNNGRSYTLQVLNAFHANKISLRTVGQLLNTNLKYINKVEARAKISYENRTSFIQ